MACVERGAYRAGRRLEKDPPRHSIWVTCKLSIQMKKNRQHSRPRRHAFCPPARPPAGMENSPDPPRSPGGGAPLERGGSRAVDPLFPGSHRHPPTVAERRAARRERRTEKDRERRRLTLGPARSGDHSRLNPAHRTVPSPLHISPPAPAPPPPPGGGALPHSAAAAAAGGAASAASAGGQPLHEHSVPLPEVRSPLPSPSPLFPPMRHERVF